MTVRKPARPGQRHISTYGFPAAPSARLTDHARLRAAQRNLTMDALRYILTDGQEHRRTGVTFYVLSRRDIPAEDLRCSRVARLEGAVALVARDGAVITLYRNPTSIRTILRKAKYQSRPRRPAAQRRYEAFDQGDIWAGPASLATG